ncbi:hypothetical protein GCM10017714_32830 [Curtobacterium pusillum]|uniref:DUF3800 domain-containing protein n=1 Tax=Curtobacterium pusillum TaxID=69373 RepID=A0ABX2MAU8_9MICO|nr:DUF3800 domain-containing protein [Curtobacterium pusillum]NUU14769.1 DUF3800 domain-containing protein [Curtobacterium pusillum]GLK31683.1 hypothetical protein GCM10017610_19680 [Curtobacterium pusillum]
MRLIFLDESARDRAFSFMGALIADAAAVRSIESGLDGIARLVEAHSCGGFDSTSEFHAVDMFHGKNDWKDVPPGWRAKACVLASKVIARSTATFVFRGIDLDGHRARYREHAYPVHLLTLAQILEAVDGQLRRLDPIEQLGLVLADDHHTADGARRSLRDFKVERAPGYTNRPLTRIADTLYFGPSHESRMLQAADLATFFFNRERTVEERDHRSATTVRTITGHIRRITVSEYVWDPRKTQRPARGRGAGWVREARERPAPR